MSSSWHRTTLIDVEELALHIDACVVVDCRHDLALAATDPQAGRRAYDELGHVPSAFFLHQQDDLAGPRNGRNGRHPLPDRSTLLARLRALGLSDGQQLVAYDDQGGVMASRLWWLARWLGHGEVAVLDGGLAAWRRAGYPLTREPAAQPTTGGLSDRAALTRHVEADELQGRLADSQCLLLDARAAERYRGDVEPLDPVAGHIPGARNRPHTLNLRPDGCFKPAPVLAAEYRSLLGDHACGQVVQSCGSGISACHNLLAMAFAGLDGAALYPGSWSEWITDPARPVATGPQP